MVSLARFLNCTLGEHQTRNKEVNHMPKYLVQVSIPTVYVIEARNEQAAMHRAAERFKKEYRTTLEPELQWTRLKGADTAAEWVIEGW
jgi:hypothetical protein